MVFSSFVFLFAFLPLLFLLYFSIKDSSLRNSVLLIFSVVFYAWGEPSAVFILLLSVLVGWIGGRQIEGRRNGRAAVIVTAMSIFFQVLLLFYYKYLGLLVDTIRFVTSIDLHINVPGLPVGISFFTFHMISYLVDVYRGEARALASYSKLLLYISLFPQLVAGPIVRYSDIQDQLFDRSVTLEGFSYGVHRFVIGLAKKVIIADTIAEITPVFLDGDLSQLTVIGAWFGIMLFALQIYFDFSGYSDMAIGLGAMFGFHLKENFEYPYLSRSASEFWRRWNISVGRFFRDYVYIPLGGNRSHPWRNLLFVWFLTGLWHGASFNFIVWGLYFGVLIALEKLFLHRVLDALPRVAAHLYFLSAVLVGWVFFYFESMERAWTYMRTMFSLTDAPLTNTELFIYAQSHMFLLLLALTAATPLPSLVHHYLQERIQFRTVRSFYVNAFMPVFCLIMLALSSLLLVGKTYSPFFYFRF